ncbi:MAG TPA: GyrI-like domain-containing protein [Tepidisphaeraceae bacterium]|nr:GyrI-like domain-containing protein [Tepidisphaeraceae bacterium]
MRKKLFSIAVCGLCMMLSGQTRPTTQPGGFSDTAVTEARIQDLRGMNYLHATQRTTIRQMNQTLGVDIEKMLAAMRANSISPAGPMMLIMKGMTQNPEQPFSLDFGFDVARGSTAPAGYQITELPAYHCASVIFSGPMTNIGMAYHQIYSSIFGAGIMPTPESREYVLYWEAPDSANNVFMIAVGIP